MSTAAELPAEILGEIFFYAIRGPISNTEDYLFPWAIGQVCQTWRHAFVTYPMLWTSISLDLRKPRSPNQDLNAIHTTFLLCLERSKKLPVQISLYLQDYELHSPSPYLKLIWKSFLFCSNRWRTIVVVGVALDDFPLFGWDLPEGPVPVLESLSICTIPALRASNCTAFHIAPRLTRFVLKQRPPIRGYKWLFPWKQLTSLVLKMEWLDTLLPRFMNVVQQLEHIQELRFVLEVKYPHINIFDFEFDPDSTKCLQHLLILEVPCPEILGLIKAPLLQELHLLGSKHFWSRPDQYNPDMPPLTVRNMRIIREFIRHSLCKIHKLTLENFVDNDIEPLIGIFPDIAELCIFGIDLLLSSIVFPGLRVLHVSIDPIHVGHAVKTLEKMLELRNGSSLMVVPLEEVVVHVKHPQRGALPPSCDDFQAALAQWANVKVEFRFEHSVTLFGVDEDDEDDEDD